LHIFYLAPRSSHIHNKPKVHHLPTQAKEIFLDFIYKHYVFNPSSICPSGPIRSSARRVLHPGPSHEGQCILPRFQDSECGNKRRQKGNHNHKTRISNPTDRSRPSFSDSQPPKHHLSCRHHPDLHSFRPHHRSRSIRRHYSLGRYGCRVLSLPLAHTGSIPRLCRRSRMAPPCRPKLPPLLSPRITLLACAENHLSSSALAASWSQGNSGDTWRMAQA
jgi:hypothetical protein